MSNDRGDLRRLVSIHFPVQTPSAKIRVIYRPAVGASRLSVRSGAEMLSTKPLLKEGPESLSWSYSDIKVSNIASQSSTSPHRVGQEPGSSIHGVGRVLGSGWVGSQYLHMCMGCLGRAHCSKCL